MKKKDIISLSISLVIIVGSIFYILKMTRPPKQQVTQGDNQAKKISEEFTGEFDKYKDALDKVEKYTDYGKPALEGIGRTNPFAPLQ